ncbi:MAG: glutamine-hydrolyzing carbamoyl-phosphate synthase small subunit [Geminicoccaceae bacterium]
MEQDAALVLTDGMVCYGYGLGRVGRTVGELVFNTGMTGYQETLTDPSYAGQIITFTFPHIGNVGANDEDEECPSVFARGLVLRATPTQPSNYRSLTSLGLWLERRDLIGIAGIDTRALTHLLRESGAQTAGLIHGPNLEGDIEALRAEMAAWGGMVGRDLAREVTCRQRYDWDQGLWRHGEGFAPGGGGKHRVVAIDYGAKRNILRHLAERDLEVIVVPATASASDILDLDPGGIFLSNGPGDPAATGDYATPELQALIKSGKPMFGICLGHQLLARALGAETQKMLFGHHGANHPVQDLATGKVEITSQNHGFTVQPDRLPEGVEVSHKSLFDGTVEGLSVRDRPIFSVQYHPEASPGPQDSAYLFDRFIDRLDQAL